VRVETKTVLKTETVQCSKAPFGDHGTV